jgi:hypothetical protein
VEVANIRQENRPHDVAIRADRLPVSSAAHVQVLPEVAEENTVSKQLAGILDAIAAAPDLRGLCAWQWDLFDQVDDPAAVEQAIGLCRQCPVLAQCAQWVASLPPRRRPVGVVAGVVRQAQ